MSNRVSGSGVGLNAVRHHVRLLIISLAFLSVAVIGHLYWHNHQLTSLERVANHYHLETVLHCTEIAEAVQHLAHFPADHRADAAHSSAGAKADSHSVNTVYLLEKHVQHIVRLHAAFESGDSRSDTIHMVMQKSLAQMDALRRASGEGAHSHIDSSASPVSTYLQAFLHSVEQLRRLHIIARGRINQELAALKSTGLVHTLMILVTALLLGTLVAWRVLAGIRRLIETQKNTEAVLRQSATVFENTSEGVLITDADARIIAANKAFTEITGYTEDEVLGEKPSLLKSGLHDREFYRDMWASIRRHGQWQGEVSDRRKNGEIFPKWLTISAVHDGEGVLTNYVSVFSDITQLKKSAERLHHLAHHDDLTGLPNRLLLHARLDHSLQHAARKNQHVAVLFIDIDHFKRINDSMGHPAGDQLLKGVSKRLLQCVRGEDTVARLGGDELTIVLGSLNDPGGATLVAEQVLDTISKPFQLEGREVFVSASIGISIYPQDGLSSTELLKNADAAMYMAKNEGRNRLHFYSSELTAQASDSLALETDLHRALERQEFRLYYQPQVCLRSGKVIGVEALIRWEHPQLGLVSPDRFIPQAEENGLIGAIGKWVLHTACEQARAWQEQGMGRLRVAVNLSGRQLGQGRIVDVVREVLQQTGLDPARLELELTESSIMKRAEQAAQTLRDLRSLGISVAIDDFGAGYSSLAYLKRFAVDRLKIDRSFVRDIPQDENDVALARAIVALGKSLDLSVVAEGVETEEQRNLLASMGCDEMQGYLFSRPLPAAELEHLLPGLGEGIPSGNNTFRLHSHKG